MIKGSAIVNSLKTTQLPPIRLLCWPARFPVGTQLPSLGESNGIAENQSVRVLDMYISLTTALSQNMVIIDE